MRYVWDDAKRKSNFLKHGLDFKDADQVLDNPLKMEVDSERNSELRRQAFADVLDVLAVLTVVYIPGKPVRIVSFRRASRRERSTYREWLKNNLDDDR